MVGQRNDSWPNSSMVVETGATCPAPAQGGKCGSCRLCWDSSIKVVSYGKHWCGITQNIIKNYVSVINWIRSLARLSRRAMESVRLVRASSPKLQALKLQATSFKPQATSIKLQAASDKLPNLQALIKFQAASIMGLDYDKTILRMTYMEANLVWWKPYKITFRYFKFNSEKCIVFIVCQYIWRT